MSKYVFPAIFTQDPEGISVHFPDLDNCFTSGENVIEAVEMANDVLGFVLCDMEEKASAIPSSSLIQSIPTQENQFTSYVVCDTESYLAKEAIRVGNEKEISL